MSKISLTIEDIFEIESAEIFNPDSLKAITAVSIDSRNIPAGNSLFIAIKGEKFDGHKFIDDAVKNGASAVMVSKSKFKFAEHLDIPVIVVKDTTIALGETAKIWRSKFDGIVIGITGSTGKTTTKELMSAILSSKKKINKTLANNNNHIGVPLTILSTTNKHDALVLELGTNHFGEIKYTAEIAKPDAALITNISYSHLEFLKNKNGVLKEKKALFDVVEKNSGKIFINNDDKLLCKLSSKYTNRATFGLNLKADLQGKIVGYDDLAHPIVELSYSGASYTFTLPLYGESSAKNFVAAATVALYLGLSFDDIKKGLKKVAVVSKRLNVKKLNTNLIIDDTYNANPDSMKSSIELLSKMNNYSTKVAVLGDMFELGDEALKHHKALVKVIKTSKLDVVYTFGTLMKEISNDLGKLKINYRHFISRTSLKRWLSENKFENSAILVKGSRGMKMEEFVEALEGKQK